MKRFEGRVTLVTGASSGIGREIALSLAREGCQVALLARGREKLEFVAQEISQVGAEPLVLTADAASLEQVQAVMVTLMDHFGGLDYLVNAAGRMLFRPFKSTGPAQWEPLVQTNLEGIFTITHEALKVMRAGGSIVNLGSAAGQTGATAMSVYAATKAALVGFSRSLAKELSAIPIRVNVVSAGIVRTPMTDGLFRFFTSEQVHLLEKRHPLGYGTPEDIAPAVLFLLSDQARWITGTVLEVDGGYSINVEP